MKECAFMMMGISSTVNGNAQRADFAAFGDNSPMRDPSEILKGMLERIEKRRMLLGLSERALSEAVTQRPNLIPEMKRGSMPSTDKSMGLADVLGCRFEWLVTGEGPETDEDSALTPRQRAFLGQLGRLPPEEQDRLLKLARALEQQDDAGDPVELRG